MKRSAKISAFAKLNLGLKILYKRPDNFHELRTVFQTISLADTIHVDFTPARKTSIWLQSEIDIPGNLIVRAAQLVMNASGARGTVEFRLDKKIPMGGGLGGGSTDAAAVLLALPALTGRNLPLEALMELGAQLGSDVPFFLLGGTALGLGRGTELYPLPEMAPLNALVVAPHVHVSTPEAYRALNRKLTQDLPFQYISSFQSRVWNLGEQYCENDFEPVVFEQYPHLKSIQRKLRKLGAKPAMLTGSGAALFGVFGSSRDVRQALPAFARDTAFEVVFVGRNRYRSIWRRQLKDHVQGELWPPQSRHAR
jgi:4-diphosphocytidyl-2-C-methyl-D-erythritol kinase